MQVDRPRLSIRRRTGIIGHPDPHILPHVFLSLSMQGTPVFILPNFEGDQPPSLLLQTSWRPLYYTPDIIPILISPLLLTASTV